MNVDRRNVGNNNEERFEVSVFERDSNNWLRMRVCNVYND